MFSPANIAEATDYACHIRGRPYAGLTSRLRAQRENPLRRWRDAVTALSRTVIEPASIPRFPRGTRFRFDATRNAWVILAPERLLIPDQIAVEVLKLVDGAREVSAIAGQLATLYAAPYDEILADVMTMLQELADDTVLEDARPEVARPTGPRPR